MQDGGIFPGLQPAQLLRLGRPVGGQRVGGKKEASQQCVDSQYYILLFLAELVIVCAENEYIRVIAPGASVEGPAAEGGQQCRGS